MRGTNWTLLCVRFNTTLVPKLRIQSGDILFLIWNITSFHFIKPSHTLEHRSLLLSLMFFVFHSTNIWACHAQHCLNTCSNIPFRISSAFDLVLTERSEVPSFHCWLLTIPLCVETSPDSLDSLILVLYHYRWWSSSIECNWIEYCSWTLGFFHTLKRYSSELKHWQYVMMWSNLRVFHIGINGHLSLAQVQKCGIVIDHCSGSGIGLIFWFTGAGQLWMERERETQFGTQCGRVHAQVQPGMSYRSSHSSVSFTSQIITLMKVTREPN